MRKIAIALVAILGMTSVAQADSYRYYGHGGYHGHGNYHGGYNRNRGGNGGDWVAPLVGGLIIGGLIGAAQQPRNYYNGSVYDYDEPQVVCYKRIVGYDYYGYPVVRRFCQYQ